MASQIVIMTCECGRRFSQTTTRIETPEEDRALCPCGRVLATWAGSERVLFEPEMDEDDPR
jgi:hypothetical protein